ncbi:MAG TPA: hydroxyphenylacetyl-CoA thioesterase PaaI [Acidothermaceae bacterium]|jgi:acyl-CoA thioesterase|nr:hydroxyphenylacetyl-CoA thioesterase PaaI [Acidothermaceae bacterium]
MTEPDDLAWDCAKALYESDVASRALGIELLDVAPGRARVSMTITEQMLNGHRTGHGGYLFTLADSAFAFACNTYDVATVASSCEIVFLAPTHMGDVLEAAAQERFRAGRRGVYDVTITRGMPPEVVAEFRGVSSSSGKPVLNR